MRSAFQIACFAVSAAATSLGAHPVLGQTPGKPVPPHAVQRPLQGIAGRQIAVFPLQYVTFADSLGWSAKAPAEQSYRTTVDDEITFALGERGLKTNWTFAGDVEQNAKRNASFTSDPRALSATELRGTTKKTDAWQLKEPLATQLRSLVAFGDARYVLIPVELTCLNAPGGARPMLHVVLIDARRSQVQWTGDVYGAVASSFSPAIAADVASRLADLVAPTQ